MRTTDNIERSSIPRRPAVDPNGAGIAFMDMSRTSRGHRGQECSRVERATAEMDATVPDWMVCFCMNPIATVKLHGIQLDNWKWCSDRGGPVKKSLHTCIHVGEQARFDQSAI